MLVKILTDVPYGDDMCNSTMVFDSLTTPVMLTLSEDEKSLISNMGDQQHFCSYPPSMSPALVTTFMHAGEKGLKQQWPTDTPRMATMHDADFVDRSPFMSAPRFMTNKEVLHFLAVCDASKIDDVYYVSMVDPVGNPDLGVPGVLRIVPVKSIPHCLFDSSASAYMYLPRNAGK